MPPLPLSLPRGLLALLAAAPAGGDLRDDDRRPVLLKSDLSLPERDVVHALVRDTKGRVEELLARWGVQPKSKGLTRLRVYSRREDFQERQERTRPYYMHWATAFYDEASQEIVSFFGDGGLENRSILAHEVAHQTLRESAKNAPPWFDEGFACYVQGLQYDAFGDRVSSLHSTSWDRIRQALLEESQCPLDELVELPPEQFYETPLGTRRPWSRETLYAESWSLMYFLLEVPGEAQRALLDALARQLDTGSLKRSQYAKALTELEAAWREFLADEDFFALDVLLLRAYRSAEEGDVLQSLSGAEVVLAQDPERLAAHRLVAQANLELGDFAGARRHFEKLVEKHPEEFAARVGLGQAVLGLYRASQAPEDAAACQTIAAAALERVTASAEETAALFLLCDAAEATGDVRGALQCVRRLLAQPDLAPEQKDELRDREARLMRDRARSGE